jgi:hypothetical protein
MTNKKQKLCILTGLTFFASAFLFYAETLVMVCAFILSFAALCGFWLFKTPKSKLKDTSEPPYVYAGKNVIPCETNQYHYNPAPQAPVTFEDVLNNYAKTALEGGLLNLSVEAEMQENGKWRVEKAHLSLNSNPKPQTEKKPTEKPKTESTFTERRNGA